MKVSLFGIASMILGLSSSSEGFSLRSSSFAGIASAAFRELTQWCDSDGKSYNWGMYNSPADPIGEGNHNAWSVLANTEKWISSTLQTANTGAAVGNNPYARKEVSYVCETQSSGSMVVAGIFRRLREAREQGEAHGDAEMDRAEAQGSFT